MTADPRGPAEAGRHVRALDRTIDALTSRLLACRAPDGHWEGRLASSALATATAVAALAMDEPAAGRDHRALVARGVEWLTAHQNADGGWGDTVVSGSNLSTTLLCWAALSFVDRAPARAEQWLRRQAGALDPDAIRRAVLARYGTDRTFSAPILAMLALTGALGSGRDAWRRVPQLPFELAACPHRWFRWMRLPVVSYALPALVAIGQVRHHHAPTWNPIARPLRSAVRARTLAVARAMQPDSGGYLEAVPLTAFVTMSLIAAGARRDPIVDRGLAFLAASARPDGSWPIDTNLATWVTTLAVRALDRLDDARRLVDWLLAQQHTLEHPFTHARPGGWGWTNLSGAVPDADDTAGALLALRRVESAENLVAAATAGIEWLLEIQNRDGGIPTFCRGWGALPFDRSAPDLTAHALEAWNAWHGTVVSTVQERIERAAARGVAYLAGQQRPDGSWAPLWFGNEHVPGELNLTYGTARVIGGLATPLARRLSPTAEACARRGVAWLVAAQRADGGWGGGADAPPSIEETGVALTALATCTSGTPDVSDTLLRGAAWLVAATAEGTRTPASPIGLYFARLWYYEELYPVVTGLAGLAAARGTIIIRNS